MGCIYNDECELLLKVSFIGDEISEWCLVCGWRWSRGRSVLN